MERAPSDIQGRLRKGGTGAGARGGGTSSQGYVPGGPSSPGGSISTAALSRTIPPPFWVRPPQAQEIAIDASATGFNNLNTPAPIPGAAFQVPTNQVGIIRSVVLSVNNLTATSALLWQMTFDGVPVQGWNQLTVFPRPAGSVSIAFGPDETFIFVPDGSRIDVQIVVQPADANTYQAGVSFHGWYYDKRLAEAFESVYTP